MTTMGNLPEVVSREEWLQYLDLTALGRQEAWEEPKGRAVPLGLHVGGPAMRLPDEYDT
jgi:hypothetical protein